jgi:hypothetical protein
MLGSNHDFQGLQPRKSGPGLETVDNWCTNDGYASGTDIEVLLRLWPGALGCCCLKTPAAFLTRVDHYQVEGINYRPCSSD